MNTTGNAPHNTPLLKQLIQNGSTKSAKTAPIKASGLLLKNCLQLVYNVCEKRLKINSGGKWSVEKLSVSLQQ